MSTIRATDLPFRHWLPIVSFKHSSSLWFFFSKTTEHWRFDFQCVNSSFCSACCVTLPGNKRSTRILAKTTKPLGSNTWTRSEKHSTYRHSHPSGPRFPVQHLARTAVCRGEETVINQKTERHSKSANDTHTAQIPGDRGKLSRSYGRGRRAET